jgi:hypothetical protein
VSVKGAAKEKKNPQHLRYIGVGFGRRSWNTLDALHVIIRVIQTVRRQITIGIVGCIKFSHFFSFIVDKLGGFDDLFSWGTTSRSSEPTSAMFNKTIKLK